MSFRHKKTLRTTTFKMNVLRTYSMQIFIEPSITLEAFNSAFVRCWTSIILRQPISHDKNNIQKTYNFKNFRIFINPLRTLMPTTLTGRTKTYTLYVNLYVFCTFSIKYKPFIGGISNPFEYQLSSKYAENNRRRGMPKGIHTRQMPHAHLALIWGNAKRHSYR